MAALAMSQATKTGGTHSPVSCIYMFRTLTGGTQATPVSAVKHDKTPGLHQRRTHAAA